LLSLLILQYEGWCQLSGIIGHFRQARPKESECDIGTAVQDSAKYNTALGTRREFNSYLSACQ